MNTLLFPSLHYSSGLTVWFCHHKVNICQINNSTLSHRPNYSCSDQSISRKLADNYFDNQFIVEIPFFISLFLFCVCLTPNDQQNNRFWKLLSPLWLHPLVCGRQFQTLKCRRVWRRGCRVTLANIHANPSASLVSDVHLSITLTGILIRMMVFSGSFRTTKVKHFEAKQIY